MSIKVLATQWSPFPKQERKSKEVDCCSLFQTGNRCYSWGKSEETHSVQMLIDKAWWVTCELGEMAFCPWCGTKLESSDEG